jgi:hypothetical protein
MAVKHSRPSPSGPSSKSKKEIRKKDKLTGSLVSESMSENTSSTELYSSTTTLPAPYLGESRLICAIFPFS